MTAEEYVYQLPKRILHDVWLDAIGHMQAYNGRTISDCIILAIGGEIIEGEDKDGKYEKTFKVPTIAEINRTFE